MNTPDTVKYQAVAVSSGGREGSVHSANPEMSLEVRTPREMGGDGHATNPEQLFALGYSACFNSALHLAARNAGVQAEGAQVRISVGVGPEGDSFALQIMIDAAIPNVDVESTRSLVECAHELCPYSKAIRGNVPVTLNALETL